MERLVDISLEMPTSAAIECYRSMLRGNLVDRIPDLRIPVLQLTARNNPVHSARGAEFLNSRLLDAEPGRYQ